MLVSLNSQLRIYYAGLANGSGGGKEMIRMPLDPATAVKHQPKQAAQSHPEHPRHKISPPALRSFSNAPASPR